MALPWFYFQRVEYTLKETGCISAFSPYQLNALCQSHFSPQQENLKGAESKNYDEAAALMCRCQCIALLGLHSTVDVAFCIFLL